MSHQTFLSKPLKSAVPQTADELSASLSELANLVGHDLYSADFATAVDALDTLSSYRQQFYIPKQQPEHHTSNTGSTKHDSITNGVSKLSTDDSVYLCGNSLGLQPRSARTAIDEEMNKWADVGVEGHFEGTRPWARIDEVATDLSVKLFGAKQSSEIAILNSLSVNLHLLLLAFYQPDVSKKGRYKIMIEEQAFCSDWHVVRSQVEFHGLLVDDAIITLSPRDGETYLRTDDICAAIDKNADHLAMVMLPGVQFYTGQLLDIKTITAAAHKHNIIAGWDLAHAAGNAAMQLHDWQVDFAAWCTYKYLNSGPGAISGIFVHSKHDNDTVNSKQLRRLSGWWGQEPQVRFQMKSVHTPKAGAQAFMLSNPPVLPTVCLQSSLKVFNKADINVLRNKSIYLTGYLEALVRLHLIDSQQSENGKQHSHQLSTRSNDCKHSVRILTPPTPVERGCQLSVYFDVDDINPVTKALLQAGVIIDERRPNVIRIAPTPLYNSFSDVYKAVLVLRDILRHQKIIY